MQQDQQVDHAFSNLPFAFRLPPFRSLNTESPKSMRKLIISLPVAVTDAAPAQTETAVGAADTPHRRAGFRASPTSVNLRGGAAFQW